MSPLDRVLDKVENAKKSDTGWLACCPAHDDRHRSLSLREASDGKLLVNCFAGCKAEEVVAAIGLRMADLFPRGERGGYNPPSTTRAVRVVRVNGEPVDTAGGVTVEQLAEARRLPADLLTGLGAETVPYFGPPAVSIPYIDERGEVVGVRYRITLDGDEKFRWRKGTKASTLLYGAQRLDRAREAGRVVVVEGETDAWTLTHHDIPVIGVPGAGMWSDEHAKRLEGIETVYVIVEPDKGGETLVEALRSSPMRPRVRVVRLDEKDVSDMHVAAESDEAFRTAFEAALAAAETLLDIDAEYERELALEQWQMCRELAVEHDILASFETELRNRDFVGETHVPVLVYLVITSRLLPKPVSLVLRGLSSAGKSYSVASVLPFFSPTAYFDRSGMSDRALIYSDESFVNRILYIAEAEAIAGDGLSAYFLRTLISENRLIYEVVEKVEDQHVTRRIEKPGPVGVILTTTRLRLHAENETRMLSLTVSDDPLLTRQILRAIALRDDEVHDHRPPSQWQALQRWLELDGERRVIDEGGFLLRLAEKIPVVAVRLRRDFALVRSLIYAHAILHQASRARDSRGRIIATLKDYTAVRLLVNDIVGEGIGATVSDDVRETVRAVQAVLNGKGDDATATRSEAQSELGLDDRATRRRLAQAVDDGFLENKNPGRGKTALYAIGNVIPDDVEVLPSAEALGLNPDNPDIKATGRGVLHPLPPPGIGDAGYLEWLFPHLEEGFITESEWLELSGAHMLIESTGGAS